MWFCWFGFGCTFIMGFSSQFIATLLFVVVISPFPIHSYYEPPTLIAELSITTTTGTSGYTLYTFDRVSFVDVNGDGLIDWVVSWCQLTGTGCIPGTDSAIYLNNGCQFVPAKEYNGTCWAASAAKVASTSPIFTIAEAAAYLKVDEETILDSLQSLRAIKIGPHWRIHRSNLDALFEKR